MAILKNTVIDDTGYLQLPVGTTAQRPGGPVFGMTRLNSTTGIMEWYNGTSWLDSTKNIIQNGLVLWLDAGNTMSYSGSGTAWSDLSGNGNNTTIVGTATYSTANGGSLRFNPGASSLSSYAIIANAACSSNFKSMPNGFTSIVGFQSYTAADTWHPIITFGDSANYVDIWQSPTNGYYGFDIPNCSPSPFGTTGLYSAGFNIWSTTLSVAAGFGIYKNNVLQTSGTCTAWTSSSSQDFTIARRPDDTSYYMDGLYAFIYIYNRVLSTAELTTIYDNIKSRYGLT